MGVEKIDLMLCHQPAGDYIAGYHLLEKACKEGKISSLGVSNFSERQIKQLLSECEIMPTVVQVECHPYFPQTKMRNFLEPYGIAIQAWFPLGHGDKSLFEQPSIQKLSEKYGKTPGQIILRWHIQTGNIVIPGAKSESHIKQNIDIFDFELKDAEMAEIAKIDRGIPYVTHDESDMDRYLTWPLDIEGQK